MIPQQNRYRQCCAQAGGLILWHDCTLLKSALTVQVEAAQRSRMFRQRSETGGELQLPVLHLCSIYNRFDASSTESALDLGSQRIYQCCLPRRICHLFSVCPSSVWILTKGRVLWEPWERRRICKQTCMRKSRIQDSE